MYRRENILFHWIPLPSNSGTPVMDSTISEYAFKKLSRLPYSRIVTANIMTVATIEMMIAAAEVVTATFPCGESCFCRPRESNAKMMLSEPHMIDE